MARPEAPIPEHRPMKALAEHLRQLRQAAGSPSYRTLGRLVHLEQQSLSQTANGRRVGWGRVLHYIDALRRHNPEAVSLGDIATLKQLYDACERQFQLTTHRGIRHRQSTALWEEIDSVNALSSRTTARHRAGRWDTTPGITDVRQLNTARDRTDLYHCLTDIAAGHGLDLKNPARSRPTRPAPAAFSWFGTTPAEPAPAPAIPQVRHPDDLTLPLLLQIVRLCGGTDGDDSAWHSTWERIHRAAPKDPVGPADGDPEPATGNPPATTPIITQRFPQGSPVWRWPGNALRRPAALGYGLPM
ncbi:hypothetical protein [Actinoplanes sp. NPDC049118]|uniref:hypothetical protein n=1 Tax=Actinoplanes sp. NPDC049118 TaxID=3155769 RepID=UPI0033CD4464